MRDNARYTVRFSQQLVLLRDSITGLKNKKLRKKVASAIEALKRIRPFVTTRTAVQVYQALIQPHFDYCCSVWDGFGETLSNKIQKLQNQALVLF